MARRNDEDEDTPRNRRPRGGGRGGDERSTRGRGYFRGKLGKSQPSRGGNRFCAGEYALQILECGIHEGDEGDTAYVECVILDCHGVKGDRYKPGDLVSQAWGMQYRTAASNIRGLINALDPDLEGVTDETVDDYGNEVFTEGIAEGRILQVTAIEKQKQKEEGTYTALRWRYVDEDEANEILDDFLDGGGRIPPKQDRTRDEEPPARSRRGRDEDPPPRGRRSARDEEPQGRRRGRGRDEEQGEDWDDDDVPY